MKNPAIPFFIGIPQPNSNPIFHRGSHHLAFHTLLTSGTIIIIDHYNIVPYSAEVLPYSALLWKVIHMSVLVHMHDYGALQL